jgi:hypothetical protein
MSTRLRCRRWQPGLRIKISNRRATQRCNVSSFFYAKICSLLARRRSSQPVQRVYWLENVIDWLGKWRPTCVMRHARGQKLQSFRRKWPFYMDLYSMAWLKDKILLKHSKRLHDQNSGLSCPGWRQVSQEIPPPNFGPPGQPWGIWPPFGNLAPSKT